MSHENTTAEGSTATARTSGYSEKERGEELMRRDVDREPVYHDVDRGQVQQIIRTFHALVNAHLAHITLHQRIRTSSLGTLLDDAIANVVGDDPADGFVVIGHSMMAVRIRAKESGQDYDHSEDERPNMVLRRHDADAQEDAQPY